MDHQDEPEVVDYVIRKLLEDVLNMLARKIAPRPKNSADLLAILKQRLSEFNKEWNKKVDDFIAQGQMEAIPPPKRGACGDFNTVTRPVGEPSGIEAGRVHGLVWMPWSGEEPAPLKESLSKLDPATKWGLESAELPFCKGGRLWHFWLPGGPEAVDADAFALTIERDSAESKIEHFDWKNEKIYNLANEGVFRISNDPYSYIRFFFHIVRGELGRFTILENDADIDRHIPWTIDPASESAQSARAAIAKQAAPIRRLSVNEIGETSYRATILFKNALFKSDVVVDLSGTVRLENEDLLIEDLPVNAGVGLDREVNLQSS